MESATASAGEQQQQQLQGATWSVPENFMYSTNMQIRMMHIQHPSKQQDDLCEFLKLREDETFTDMIFVTAGDKVIRVHSLVLAATSDFLKTWMETTYVPDLKVSAQKE